MLRTRIAPVRMATMCLFLAALYGNAAEESIYWYKDLKQASEAAQKADLPMFIDFWADWCAPCKIMDAEVYTNEEVIEVFRNKIIGARIHFDLQQDVARKYNVLALPFLVFTNSYGTPLLYHRGFLDAKDLAKIVGAMPPLSEINRLDRILREDKDHFQTLVAMGRTLRAAGFYEASNTYYERAVRRNEAKRDAAQREPILVAMGNNWLALQDGKKAAEMFERCLKEFPKNERSPDCLLGLGRAYLLDNKKDKGRRALQSVIAEYPQNQAARIAQELLSSL